MTKHLEDDHQKNLITWARMARVNSVRIGDYLFAIPNGGKRNVKEAARLKAQGVKAGVSDLFLPVPASNRAGLWIEMKVPKPNKSSVSESQREWQERMNSAGYMAVVAYGWIAARETIKTYLQGGDVSALANIDMGE